MKLYWKEANKILFNFPQIELSYEKKSHKKIHSDFILTIPKGKKYFAWFRTYKTQNVCFFLELDKRKKRIITIYQKYCCFNSELCCGKGTILYGTIFRNKCEFFNIENIYYYKNKNVNNCNQSEKLLLFKSLFKNDIKQIAYRSNHIIFGLPIIATNKKDILTKIQDLNYPLYSIQHRFLFKNSTFINEDISNCIKINKIFMVKARVEEDIYELFYNNDDEKLEFYETAIISDYKTSVWMNSLFRNIKENDNLDYLEESEDEDFFQNIETDKFIHHNTQYKIECEFSSKFNSWKPLRKIDTGNICNKKQISHAQKYNN